MAARAQSLHQAQQVFLGPGFGDLAVCDAVHVHPGQLDRFARRRNTPEFAGVLGVDRQACGGHVAVGDELIVDAKGIEMIVDGLSFDKMAN